MNHNNNLGHLGKTKNLPSLFSILLYLIILFQILIYCNGDPTGSPDPEVTGSASSSVSSSEEGLKGPQTISPSPVSTEEGLTKNIQSLIASIHSYRKQFSAKHQRSHNNHNYNHNSPFSFIGFNNNSPMESLAETLESLSELTDSNKNKELNKIDFRILREAYTLLGEFSLYGDDPRFPLIPSYSLAISYFNRSSSLGCPVAQFYLGVLYSHGIGLPRDEGLALTNFYFSALGGYERSRMALGYRHLYGYGLPLSCESSVQYYSPVAENVINEMLIDPISTMVERIRLSDISTHSAQDDEDIVQYYQHSAENGDINAQVALGHLHFYGARGFQQNPYRAASYFQAAHAQGDLTASTTLGHMYLQGVGVKQDNNTAFKLFKQGADLGNPAAQNGLGYLYLHGIGCTQDLKLALSFFKQSADAMNAEAQFNLGSMYFTGLGVEQKYATAIQYFSMAAAQGHTRAIYNLGLMHLHGLGTIKSCGIGVKLLKTVAERGEYASQLSEAHKAWRAGLLETSFIRYILSAEEGHEVAHANIAYLMEGGYAYIRVREEEAAAASSNGMIILNQDGSINTTDSILGKNNNKQGDFPLELLPPGSMLIKAVNSSVIAVRQRYIAQTYLQHACAQGNVDAYRQLGDLAYYGLMDNFDPGVNVTLTPNYEKAASLYKTAAEQRNAHALFNLGYMHTFGIGVPQDFHLAKRNFDNALEVDQEAFAPVMLALAGLWLHQFWNQLWIEQPKPLNPSTNPPPISSTTPSNPSHNHEYSLFSFSSLDYEMIEDIVLYILCAAFIIVVYLRARR